MDNVREAELSIASLQYRIDELEFNRLRDLADVNMQQQLLTLLKQQHQLKQYLQKAIFIRRDDEDVFTLLACIIF